MLGRVRSAVAQLVGALGPAPGAQPPRDSPPGPGPGPGPAGGAFCRPAFLQLTSEELQRADDHAGRAVQSPRESRRLPWSTGYAEVINAGKSQHNEDQACCEVVVVGRRCSPQRGSLAPQESAVEAEESDWRVLPAERGQAPLSEKEVELPNDALPRFHLEKAVSHESLVIGAIENAFRRMDKEMEWEQTTQLVAGGCCALAAVYLLGKFYVANAGDSRAIIIRNGEIIPMSREFTPETERQRLQLLGFLRPELLGNEFTHLEFPRRIQHKELGKKMLYRDQNMNGWAYKRIVEDDLKFPLIYGEGKKARVMATIGVTRGLGDHDLKVYNSNIHIKPFLSCVPEVRVYDLTQYEHCPDDVLVLGTDGLWDVTSDREVANVVTEVLMDYEPNDPCRYTVAAHELVVRSRGVLKERGWRLANNKLGSGDDISVFVIPLGGPGNYT
ncbi:protein phosphatase 1J isoform X3 [Carettochelys insculpta]|uniref:protein phosphatase 1J isoform X3 n=1 Tax=Carettochelys insculpta TaxID=44489 RepID=UPI003EB866C2